MFPWNALLNCMWSSCQLGKCASKGKMKYSLGFVTFTYRLQKVYNYDAQGDIFHLQCVLLNTCNTLYLSGRDQIKFVIIVFILQGKCMHVLFVVKHFLETIYMKHISTYIVWSKVFLCSFQGTKSALQLIIIWPVLFIMLLLLEIFQSHIYVCCSGNVQCFAY